MSAPTTTPPPARPNILVLPVPSLYRRLFAPETERRLRALGNVTVHADERNVTSAELAGRIGGFDVVVTGWGSPRFTDDVLAAAGDRLKLVAHSAGTIKHMLPEAALERFRVTTVAAAMAPVVAEFGLLLTLLSLRPVHKLDAAMHAGADWRQVKTTTTGDELASQRIGVVGTGNTGRAYIRLVRALGVETWAYDPYLSDARAAELGVRRVQTLDELMAGCDIVSIQAPSTPETHKMIGRRELGLLRDGARLINTARSWVIDMDALLEELRSGRISAALDVYDQEPLPSDHPLRSLDDVILTPHVASATPQCHFRQGQMTVDELERFVRGQPLRYEVTRQMLATMA
jgi:phosphoglycerate dehydrogenase-like enzyme